MRETASKRLQLQRAAEEAAQAAVTPAAVGTDSPRPPPTVEPQRTGVPIQPVYPAIAMQAGSSDPKPKPRTEQPWLKLPFRSGRSLWPSRKPPVSTESLSSGGFHVLKETGPEPEPEQNSAGSAQAPSIDGVTDDSPIKSEPPPNMAPDVARARPRLSSEDRVRQKDSKRRGAAPEISGPTLLAKQRLERKTCKRLVKQQQKGRCTSFPIDPRPETGPFHLNDLKRILGLREVPTPATGNCLAMAIAQAVADSALDAPLTVLEPLTASVKRGFKYAGLLNLEGQLPHDLRVNILKNVGRGWQTMTREESATQLRWFLTDFAATSFDRDTIVSESCWGGSDILGMAATFLQRNFFVIHVEDDNMQWSCRKYHPTKVQLHGSAFDTAKEYPLSITACTDDLQVAKIEVTDTLPLVLRFWGRHYSAFLHTDNAKDLTSLTGDLNGPNAELSQLSKLPAVAGATQLALHVQASSGF
uniref:OTU domain-containing protein n=1 Tax=Peronospora matthiolae TaxID=2874970 RepID=A0AAV1TQ58_9STRA